MVRRMLGMAMITLGILAVGVDGRGAAASAILEETAQRLAEEVRGKGWIVFSARSDSGDWDLFLMQPDGAQLRNITRTPKYNEAAPQFSRDGRRLLYRRLARQEAIDGNHYGAQGELVFANSDGTKARAFGKSGQYPWASWSPDGKQIVCLSIKGIFFVDIASRKVVRTLKRKGFFQQLTWSPDGKCVSGVANSFGTGWSVARMEVAAGTANAVSRVDCCTPDWFPDSRRLVFSSRPPGQKENNGQGWTQLWTADAEGRSRRLVYGEDGRHVYGGHVSPDGKYVLFTGNMHEDGDPGGGGAPMGLMRLADGPIIGGQSSELRARYPQAQTGPVLVLPVGWEPCWTFAEVLPDSAVTAGKKAHGTSTSGTSAKTRRAQPRAGADALAAEVRNKGWIVSSAATGAGDWDLFLMRPDGSGRRKITDTRAYNEAGARFSPDGTRILYYRLPSTEPIDNNTYGTYELVIAEADGSDAVLLGSGFQWASWGPDGKRLASLAKSGIRIIDLTSRTVVRRLARKGIVQQLVWSPDGKWFAGTANGLGPYWNIGRLGLETGQVNAVSETERYNCTPDWMPDASWILYSRGIIPEVGGFAELWVGSGNGQEKRLVCAQQGRHLYGGCASPDGKYVLFTRSEADLGKVDNSRTRMAIVRWKDTPMVVGESKSLRTKYPEARRGPVLDLSWGWEPHWTYSQIKPAPDIRTSPP